VGDRAQGGEGGLLQQLELPPAEMGSLEELAQVGPRLA
jgi:hypothetical protein